jgi:hypothetical protein
VPPQPSEYDTIQNIYLFAAFQNVLNQVIALEARVAVLEDIETPPTNVITVGSGGDYADFAAAWPNAQDGDTLRLISNVTAASLNDTAWLDGLDDILLDWDGYDYDVNSGTGDGLGFTNCKRLRIRLGAGGRLRDTRATPQANVNAIAVGHGCKWTIIESDHGTGTPGIIDKFAQGIATMPGYWMTTPVTNASTEHVWVDGINLTNINDSANHTSGPSAITFFQVAAVADDATGMPTRWKTLLSRHGFSTTDESIVAAATNNRIAGVKDTIADSDGNAILLADDWEQAQFRPGGSAPANNALPLNTYNNGVRRAYAANNSGYNCRGSMVRLFNSATPGGHPFLVRNNTGKLCGQRAGTWEKAVFSVADQGYNGSNAQFWGGTMANNLSIDCGVGGADSYQLSGTSQTGTTWTANQSYSNDSGGGFGTGVIGNPNLQSGTDPNAFYPASGGTADNIGSSSVGDPVDADDRSRPSPPSVGAYEPA